MSYKLYNDDCFNIMQKLVDDNIEVDMILTDLPYGTVKGLDIDGWTETSTEWDNRLDTEKIFSYSEKLLKEKCPMILFSQEPYTSYLRQYNYTNMFFTYPLYWIKNHFANPLSCKKAPVSYVEESAKRYEQLFSKCDNLKTVYVYSRRINCYRNNNFNMKGKSSIACYCWFVFDKEYKSKPMIDWIY